MQLCLSLLFLYGEWIKLIHEGKTGSHIPDMSSSSFHPGRLTLSSTMVPVLFFNKYWRPIVIFPALLAPFTIVLEKVLQVIKWKRMSLHSEDTTYIFDTCIDQLVSSPFPQLLVLSRPSLNLSSLRFLFTCSGLIFNKTLCHQDTVLRKSART